jgi:hypothetical protein
MDSNACNYDPAATLDDGNCILVGDSCNDGDGTTENDAINENCECEGTSTLVFGCTVISACNYNPLATAEDSSCIFIGDTCDDNDPTTINDSIQTDCSCMGEEEVIVGCTDPDACNYNAQAAEDDGSCEYLIDGIITGDVLPEAFSETSYSYPSTLGSTYTWDAQNGVITVGQGTASISVFWGAQGTGTLSVQETSEEGCVGSLVELDVIVTPVGVEFVDGSELQVFPVPANEELWVHGSTHPLEYFLYDSMGALVQVGNVSGDFRIATAELRSGNYVLHLVSNQQVSTHKIVIIH